MKMKEDFFTVIYKYCRWRFKCKIVVPFNFKTQKTAFNEGGFFITFEKKYFNDNKNRFFVFLENNHVQKWKFFDTFFDNFFRLYAYSKSDF